MRTDSVVKLAREGKVRDLALLPVNCLTNAIVSLEYKRLTSETLNNADAAALHCLHSARVAFAEEALASYRADAKDEESR